MRRFHKAAHPGHGKNDSVGTVSVDGNSSHAQDGADEAAANGEGASAGRKIYFNLPLPDEAKDENGHPLARYETNKIRTAKYTPLSFLPKNLYFQLQNVANIYFLFIIILSVRPLGLRIMFAIDG